MNGALTSSSFVGCRWSRSAARRIAAAVAVITVTLWVRLGFGVGAGVDAITAAYDDINYAKNQVNGCQMVSTSVYPRNLLDQTILPNSFEAMSTYLSISNCALFQIISKDTYLLIRSSKKRFTTLAFFR